jgi:hypothetical protein
VNLQRHPCDEGAVREAQGMTDAEAATNMELAAGSQFEAVRERRFPLGVIVYAVLAVAAQVLWLGALGWWLLNLF